MQDEVNATATQCKHVPWNKGKLTGAKPLLRPKHVWRSSASAGTRLRPQTRKFLDCIDSWLRRAHSPRRHRLFRPS
jgi:hypothetical protein